MSDTLWELAAAEVHAREKEAAEETAEPSWDPSGVCERTVFFMGTKAAFFCFDRDETPKSTLALEYTFGRRARGHNKPKDIAHFWELGGGTSLSDLIQIPVTVQNVGVLAVVLILDLSKPNLLFGTAERLLQATQTKVNRAFSDLQRTGGSRSSKPFAPHRAPHILHKDHPDRELINPFPVPLLIIGSKFDIFQDFDSEKRKVISKTLRFLAHYYGASLIFSSTKSESLMAKTRSFVTHLAFGTERGKSVSIDPSKPLIIPTGMDSFSQIGESPYVDVGTFHARNPFDLWKKVFEKFFPPEHTTSDLKKLKDPAKDPQYSEPQIDSMRAQKDQELEQYKKNASKSWKGIDLELQKN
ncbi:cytoplasmic dynein 2 light intermediate chain 1 [Arapaima gigas]